MKKGLSRRLRLFVLAAVFLAALAVAFIARPVSDPLVRFYSYADRSQVYVSEDGTGLVRVVVLKVEQMNLERVSEMLVGGYRRDQGWELVESTPWRVQYQRKTPSGTDYVRCLQAIGRPGVNIEERRHLGAEEVLRYRFRQWIDRV